jgi:hypothetical protein
MRTLFLILLFCAAAFAQYADGISVSVNRTVTLTADEAVFTVVVSTGLDVTADQATQALQSAGLQNLTVSGVGLGQPYSYPEPSAAQTYYQFTFTMPASNLKDAAKKLEAIRTAPPEIIASLQYAATVNASAATLEAARQTVLPQLLAEAQKKAQFLAASANVKLGAIKGVNESSYGTYAFLGSWISTPAAMYTNSSTNNSTGMQYTLYASVTFGVAP